MESVIAWLVANHMLVLGLVGALIAAAAAAVKLTPSKKDDEIVGKIDAAWDKVEDLVKGKDEDGK